METFLGFRNLQEKLEKIFFISLPVGKEIITNLKIVDLEFEIIGETI